MKAIRVFSPNLDLLAEISNYESLMFTRSWHGIGDLELQLNRYKKYSNTLQKGNIVVIGNDKHKAYKILHREILLDENGKVTENWMIKALELKAVTGQRITLPSNHTAYDTKYGSAETVLKHYVNKNIVNPVDLNRKIEQLMLAEDLDRGINVSWQSRFKNVAEEMQSISLLSNIGWNIKVDYQLRKWIFDVIEGRDLSVNQSDNNPVIFSPQFDNIKNMNFTDSDLNYKNTAYVAGQGEGVDRRVIELGNYSGLNRHETFIDARDVAEETEEDTPAVRPEADIIADLTTRGKQTLAEMNKEIFLEAQILTPYKLSEMGIEQTLITQFQPIEFFYNKERLVSTFIYEQDWDLGDIVTVQNKDWGITLDARITEVREIYEPNRFELEATFGNSRPTLIDKIKQQLSQISPEIRR